MWFRVFIDDKEVDVIYANSEEDAIVIAENIYSNCDNLTIKQYQETS